MMVTAVLLAALLLAIRSVYAKRFGWFDLAVAILIVAIIVCAVLTQPTPTVYNPELP